MTTGSARIEAWRGRLDRLGVWCTTDPLTADDASAIAGRIEALGYTALWLPDTIGRDPFAHAALLGARTTTLVLATGIASVFHREPGPMLQVANTLAEQTGDRFVLGLGVSHRPMVEGLRGLRYERPLSTMRDYLDRMDSAPYGARPPDEPPLRVLAALGPRMLELAATRADGALTYWGTPGHTAQARSALGDDSLLCVEQKVVLTEDAEVAHATAAAALELYAALPNYRSNWLRLGFTDDQVDAGDPALLDALVAWGPVDAIEARVREHRDAGADHVCIQPLSPHHPFRIDPDALERLAPATTA